jgi:hypothetical protein
VVVGEDFNLIRGRSDKNNQNIDWGLVDLFNEFVADQQLQVLKGSGSKFIWTNK